MYLERFFRSLGMVASYPPELEKIGRYIVHQCQGLPLAVVAIGGLLSKMSKETSSWENVAVLINYGGGQIEGVIRPISPRLQIPHCDNFPTSFKKLTLCKTHLQWEDMNFLRKLPNLEDMNLKQWEATSYHFPSLEHLVLTACYFLEQIPFDFAEIQTLQLIELHKCQLSVIASAEQIQEEQQSLGNDDLIVQVHYIGE
ncbi:hypothetical protein HAX54_049486 [Datura stramonium]|uniref:NB-ARC domain-containing protein n=1 Tax=Datura stramonium TaxID=4076 RepID=A0ABS8RU40_DATST|nr:hypothetical protein [Datura stramonium]